MKFLSCRMTFEAQIIVWKEGKYYVALCLNIDVASFGRTRKKALQSIEEALSLRLGNECDLGFYKMKELEIVESEIHV